MKTFLERFRAWVLNDSVLSRLVSDRVGPDVPYRSKEKYPCVVYTVVHQERDADLAGPGDARFVTLFVDVYATDYETCKQMLSVFEKQHQTRFDSFGTDVLQAWVDIVRDAEFEQSERPDDVSHYVATAELHITYVEK